MEELADEIDISHQALSEQLRRAYKILTVPVVTIHGTATGPGPEPETPNDR